ncbi:MAG TPA: sugar phosphate isomerase/epimerase [Anaerolineae bacterium]|nr:sugar phosphate isomerase/epimerase [Anaerolineae bacterium]HIQ04956.1 sugar phosphate isomerase/epimerase [Anaerolineae bacterium]
MKIGLLIRYTSGDVDFVVRHGFGSVELLMWPGDPLDPIQTSADELRRAADNLRSRGLEISALGAYPNVLDPDPVRAKAAAAHLDALLDACHIMGVDVMGCFAGRDPEKDVLDNVPAFRQVFTPLVHKAEELGVTIAIENCPMFRGFPFRGVNIAYTPEAWDAMFEAVPSPALGLEYDPSHLVQMLMDYEQVIYDYGERIFHVHAKDAEVRPRILAREGVYGKNWHRDRMPGLGDVNWRRVISALVEVGYNGNLDIEGRHDPIYQGEREQEGLLLAKRHLEQFVV